MMMMANNVRVAVRVRPMIKRETEKNAKIIVEVSGDTISVINLKVPENSEADSRERVKQFTFDYSYWHADADSMKSRNSTQEVVFQDLGTEMLDAMFDGYNACMLAYGPSGSGKTFTMMGQENEGGLIPRICKTLFSKINEVIEEKVTFRIDVSYLEIYNERVQDLLQSATNKKKKKVLKVREHPKLGPYVQDLSRHKVTDFQTVLALVDKGNENRSIAATENHQHSSRSHAIFTINCTQARLDAELPSEIISKIHLVDLAGSERASNAFNKVRLKESSNINKSLVTLGNVISALADKSLSSWSLESLGSSFSINSSTGESVATTPLCSPRRLRQPFVPYRDSVLTWMLKDSLGGNSKTIMITTVSPASICYSETINTLRYAQRTKCIVNRPVVNEEPNVKLIRQLKAEIARLRKLLLSARVDNVLSPMVDENSILEILNQNENKAKALTTSWFAKWHYALNFVEELSTDSFSEDVSLCRDNLLPHFIVLDNHILSTGIHIYYLKEGRTTINKTDDAHNFIKDYCHLDFDGCKVMLSPVEKDCCQLNGQSISDPVQLCQADILKLGNNYTLRFNHPSEVQRLQKDLSDVNSVGNMSSSFNRPLFHNSHCFFNAEPFVNAVELVPLVCGEINENNGSSCCPLVNQSENHHQNEVDLNHQNQIVEYNEHAMENMLNARNLVLPGSLNFSHDSGAVIPLSASSSNGMADTLVVQKAITRKSDDLHKQVYAVCVQDGKADESCLRTECCQNDGSVKSIAAEISNAVKMRPAELTSVNDPVSSRILSTASISPDTKCAKLNINHDSSLSPANDLTTNGNVPSGECSTTDNFKGSHDKSTAAADAKNFNTTVNGKVCLPTDHCHHQCCLSQICKLHQSLSKNGHNLPSMTEILLHTNMTALATSPDQINLNCKTGYKLHQKWIQNGNTWNSFQDSIVQPQEADSLSSVMSEDSAETASSSSFCSHPEELLAFDNGQLQAGLGATQMLNNQQLQKFGDVSSLPRDLPKALNCEKDGYSDLLFLLSSLLKSNNMKVAGKKFTSHKFKKGKRSQKSLNTNLFATSSCINDRLCKTSIRCKIMCVKRKNVMHSRPQKCWNTSSKLKAVLVRAYLKTALAKKCNVQNPANVNAKNDISATVHDKEPDTVLKNSTSNNSSEICKDIRSSQNGEIIFNTNLMNDIKNFINVTKYITDSHHIIKMLGKDLHCAPKFTTNSPKQVSVSGKVLNIINNVNSSTEKILPVREDFIASVSSAKRTNQETIRHTEVQSNIKSEKNENFKECNSTVVGNSLISTDSEHREIEANDSLPSTQSSVTNSLVVGSSNNETKEMYMEKVNAQVESDYKINCKVPAININCSDASLGELKRTTSFCFNQTLTVESAEVKGSTQNTAMHHENSRAKKNSAEKCDTFLHVDSLTTMCHGFHNESTELKPQSTSVPDILLLPSSWPTILVENSSTLVSHETTDPTIANAQKDFFSSFGLDLDDRESVLIPSQENSCWVESTANNIGFLSVTPPDTELKRTLSNTDIQQALQSEETEGATVNPLFCPSLNHPPKVRTNSWPEPSQLSLEQLDNEIQDLQEGLKVDLVNEVLFKIGEDIGPESDENPSERYCSDLQKSESQEQFSDSLEETDDKSRCWHRSKYFNSNTDAHSCGSQSEDVKNLSGVETRPSIVAAETSGRRSSLKLVRQTARIGLSVDGELTPEEIPSSYSDDSLDESTKKQFKKLPSGKTEIQCLPLHEVNESVNNRKVTNDGKLKMAAPGTVGDDSSETVTVADDVNTSYSDDFESDDDADENDSNVKDFEDAESVSDEEIFYIPADPANPNWSLYYVSSDSDVSNDKTMIRSEGSLVELKQHQLDNSKQDVAATVVSETLQPTHQNKIVYDDSNGAKNKDIHQIGNEVLSDDGFFEVDNVSNDYSKGIENVTLTKLHSPCTYSNMQTRDIDEWENEDFSLSSSTMCDDSSEDIFMADAFSYCPGSSVDVFIDYRMIPTQERRRLYTIPELSSEYSSTPSDGVMGNVSEAESLQANDDSCGANANDSLDGSLPKVHSLESGCEDQEQNLLLDFNESPVNISIKDDEHINIRIENSEAKTDAVIALNENVCVDAEQVNASSGTENTVDCKELWQLYKRFSEESDEDANASDEQKQKKDDANGENEKSTEIENCQQDVDRLLENLEIIPTENVKSLSQAVTNCECDVTNKCNLHDNYADKSVHNAEESLAKEIGCCEIEKESCNNYEDKTLKFYQSMALNVVSNTIKEAFDSISEKHSEIQGQCQEPMISLSDDITLNCPSEAGEINECIDANNLDGVLINNELDGENVFIDLGHEEASVLNELQTFEDKNTESTTEIRKIVEPFSGLCDTSLNKDSNDTNVGQLKNINSEITVVSSLIPPDMISPDCIQAENNSFMSKKNSEIGDCIFMLPCESDVQKCSEQFLSIEDMREVPTENSIDYPGKGNVCDSSSPDALEPNKGDTIVGNASDVQTQQLPDSTFLLSHYDLHLFDAIDCHVQKTLGNSIGDFDHASETMKRPLNGEHSSETLATRLTSCRENDVSGNHHHSKQEICVGSGTDSPTLTPPTRMNKAVVDKAIPCDMAPEEGDMLLFCSETNGSWGKKSSECIINDLFQDEFNDSERESKLMFKSDEVHSKLVKALEADSCSKNESISYRLVDEQEFMAVNDDDICSEKMPLGFHPAATNGVVPPLSLDNLESKGIIGQGSPNSSSDTKSFHLMNDLLGNQTESSCCSEQWNFESWLSHLPYTSAESGSRFVDDLLESSTSLLPEQSNEDSDAFSFSKEDVSVIAALGTTFHSDIFGHTEIPESTQPEDSQLSTTNASNDNADGDAHPLQTTNSVLCVGTSSNVPWVGQRFVRESSITPDSLENFQQSEQQEQLTSWQNNRTSLQPSRFTIRTSPAPCTQPLDAKSVFEDPWGASSDSITFVFVGPNFQACKSSSDPSAVLEYMEQFDDPGSLMLRSASLDCINRRPKRFGMLPYTLNTRASSMESMIPEDLMGVVERGRIHEIGTDGISKGHSVTLFPQQPKSTPSKAYSQSSVIGETQTKKAKKSVSWGDLSGCGLTLQRPMTMPSPFLLKPIIKKLDSTVSVTACNDVIEKTEKMEYTDDDVENDLKNSALYSRIHKKCHPTLGHAAVPSPLPSFKLQLPAHVKARINHPKSETTLHPSSGDVEKIVDSKLDDNVPTETVSSRHSTENGLDDHASDPESENRLNQLPSMLAPFTWVVENLFSSKEAADISAKAVALQDKSLTCNRKDLSSFLMETSKFFQRLSLICDQNDSNVLNRNNIVTKTVSVSTSATDAATQTDQMEKLSVATNTSGNEENYMFVGQRSDCILTALSEKQYFNITSPVLKHAPSSVHSESVLQAQCCTQNDFHNINCSSNLQSEGRQPFSSSLSSIPRMDSDSASGSPSSSASVGRAVQVNTLFPRTSSKRSWVRREACLRKELEILSKEKENVLCQLENQFGSEGDESSSNPGSPDSPQYLFTYHDRLQKACARIVNKLEKLAHQKANENRETLPMLNSWASFPRTDGSSLSISSSGYAPLQHQDAIATSNLSLSPSCIPLSQLSGSSISSLNTCGSEPLRLRPRDYREQLVNFRRNLLTATGRISESPTPKTNGKKRASSSSLLEQNCVEGNSSAEDIQALLRECRVARAKAQREIELAQQQLTAQRSAVKGLESVLRHRTQ